MKNINNNSDNNFKLDGKEIYVIGILFGIFIMLMSLFFSFYLRDMIKGEHYQKIAYFTQVFLYFLTGLIIFLISKSDLKKSK